MLNSLELNKSKKFCIEFEKTIKDDPNKNYIMKYLINVFFITRIFIS